MLERAAEKWEPVFREKAREIKQNPSFGDSTGSPKPEFLHEAGVAPKLTSELTPPLARQ
jgi:hypothetical protein